MTQEELIDKGCGETILEPYPISVMRKILDLFTKGNTEEVRHILAKRNYERISKLEPEFFCRCETRGYDRVTVQKIWDLLFIYAKHAVCKTLVSIYTFVAYQFAYLKVHYKNEFCAAIICAN